MVDTITNDRTLKNPITETWKVLQTLCHAGEKDLCIISFLSKNRNSHFFSGTVWH